MFGVAIVTGAAQLATAASLLFADADGGLATAIAVAVVTSVIGAVGSIVGAVLARGIRNRDDEQDRHLRELEQLVSAPRRIGARAGDDDPVLQPPDRADGDAE